jgi:hypothetical protein
MNRVRFLGSLVGVILAACVWVSLSTAATTQYSLSVPPSALEVGCFGPCDCAVTGNPTYGSFDLTFLRSDGLYSYYAVERYIASFNNGPGAVAIVGSGEYKVGGEVALTQQMTLDIQVWGGPVQHLDSGVVPVSTAFPKIHVTCPQHGFACHDSVLVVDGAPIGTTGVPAASHLSGIAGVQPNPFLGKATILVDRTQPGPVEVAIFDLSGTRVRRLGTARLSGAEPLALQWDGRRDDGQKARAGVYWVRATWPGGSDGRRLVKLE